MGEGGVSFLQQQGAKRAIVEWNRKFQLSTHFLASA
jgi:hypothetical protein